MITPRLAFFSRSRVSPNRLKYSRVEGKAMRDWRSSCTRSIMITSAPWMASSSV